MFSNFSNSCTTSACSLSNNKFSKRFRRKRRKNKHKNSTAKKKNQKQYTLSNRSHTSDRFKFKKSELNKSQQHFGNKFSMSEWYWSNYKKAFEWQGKHSLAYWKSCALALQEENRYLLQVINSLRPDMSLKTPVNLRDEHNEIFVPERTSNKRNLHMPSKIENRDYERSENSENEDFEIEMSEEMIQYFEQSFKHKMSLEKEKQENELQEMDKKVKQLQENKMKRTFEMKLLYGDEASKIIGMETAVQLSYDKYCDSKSPKYWPNIPLRL